MRFSYVPVFPKLTRARDMRGGMRFPQLADMMDVWGLPWGGRGLSRSGCWLAEQVDPRCTGAENGLSNLLSNFRKLLPRTGTSHGIKARGTLAVSCVSSEYQAERTQNELYVLP